MVERDERLEPEPELVFGQLHEDRDAQAPGVGRERIMLPEVGLVFARPREARRDQHVAIAPVGGEMDAACAIAAGAHRGR